MDDSTTGPMRRVRMWDILSMFRELRMGTVAAKATAMALAERFGEYSDGDTMWWECWPSQTALAQDTEQTSRAVRNHLAKLEEMGVVSIVRERDDSGRHERNRYLLNVEVLMLMTSGRRNVIPPDPEERGRTQPEERGDTRPLVVPERSTNSLRSGGTPIPPANRRTNPVWDALVDNLGWSPSTPSEQTLMGKTVRELKQAMDGMSTDEMVSEISRRCRRYRDKYRGLDLTPTALMNHWSRLAVQRREAPAENLW